MVPNAYDMIITANFRLNPTAAPYIIAADMRKKCDILTIIFLVVLALRLIINLRSSRTHRKQQA